MYSSPVSALLVRENVIKLDVAGSGVASPGVASTVSSAGAGFTLDSERDASNCVGASRCVGATPLSAEGSNQKSRDTGL